MTNGSSWQPSRFGKRVFAGLLTAGMLGSLALTASQATAVPVPAQQTINTVATLTPKPNVVQATPGVSFTIPEKACVSLSDPALKVAVDILNERLNKSYGVELSTAAATATCPIHISKVQSIANVPAGTQSNEAYQLDVNAQGIRLEATSLRGAIWGSQTLLQLIGPWVFSTVRLADTPKVPGVHIVDAPRFHHRGLMLDPARSFYPVNEVKRIIDVMSYMKMNVLHIHISDDQGFRVEITNAGRAPSDNIDYTRLAQASKTTSYLPHASKFNPTEGRKGYYTQQQFIDLVTYAARHGIGIIPEVDGPGHTGGLLHAIPQLNTNNSYPRLKPGQTVVPSTINTYWASALDTQAQVTYTFINHVMTQLNDDIKQGVDASGVTEVLQPYFHLGGDELAYPRNLPDRNRKQREALQQYLGKTGKLVADAGMTPIVWNDGLAAADQLPEGSVVQVWIGNPNSARSYVQKHHGKLILSPMRQTYLVQWPETNVTAPDWACRPAACTNRDYYNWNPTAFAGVPESSILGVEPAVWSEHLRTLHDTEFMMYPRMFATAEVAWTLQAKRDYNNWASRIGTIGLALINGLHTFHLAPTTEIPSWFGQYVATYTKDVTAGSTVQIGSIAKPGITTTNNIHLTASFVDNATKQATPLPVTLALAQPFHYQDPHVSSGRYMNSPVSVSTVVPEALAGKTGRLVVTGVVPDSSRGTIAIVPAFTVNSTSVMTIAPKEAPVTTPTPTPSPVGGQPVMPSPETGKPAPKPMPVKPTPAPEPSKGMVPEPSKDVKPAEPGKRPMTPANPVASANKSADPELASTGSSVLPLAGLLVVLLVAATSSALVKRRHS